MLTKEEVCAIESQKKYYENSRSVVIEALKIVQKKRGWISDPVIFSIAKILNIYPSEVDEVATFYSQIFRSPVGRNVIRYCDSVVCFLTGYQNIELFLKSYLKINIGETTPDNRFTLLPVCCLGNCDNSPTMMVNEDTYSNVTPESIPYLLESYK
ncbi:MAG: NADH-quinone oxidoreductase subunit NuoE [Buchnera aphidicola (Pentalonia nigronervosa)]|jgi:NADH-quinone oxidoreductase subunit E|uniref:NADH-quinone oxidoreductase subunit E n=1 Tax=Buchnera aphidicola (Pentalonia nigronervosa) TaxID=1309793 RepID=A0A7H1AZI0_9GAMM|nr:MAG: NADH-quinone oxidoreductase subunit NuoE [Buchnera aphidicola (Pentalonia nigronervosa)]